MIISPDLSSKLAIDTKGLNDLHGLVKRDPDQALHKAAQQFEALFMNMLLKSMREATPKDGLFESRQTEFFTQMYDQQLAQQLSTRGIGIANIMVKQLARSADSVPVQSISQTDAILSSLQTIHQSALTKSGHSNDKSEELWPGAPSSMKSMTSVDNINHTNEIFVNPVKRDRQSGGLPNSSANFIEMLLPHAKTAAQSTGIPPHFMLAQAALESGWGKHEIRHADNSPSYNLFGIKAGANWKGDVVETMTTEYINGVPQKTVEKFRAYNSYAEGFHDYARLLADNPRYAKVLQSTDAASFANGLQRAGYATDPQYAEKLLRILNSERLQNREFI